MDVVEMLRQALKQEDITKSPDYLEIIEYLGLPVDEEPDLVREAIETELREIEPLYANLPDDDEDLNGHETFKRLENPKGRFNHSKPLLHTMLSLMQCVARDFAPLVIALCAPPREGAVDCYIIPRHALGGKASLESGAN